MWPDCTTFLRKVWKFYENRAKPAAPARKNRPKKRHRVPFGLAPSQSLPLTREVSKILIFDGGREQQGRTVNIWILLSKVSPSVFPLHGKTAPSSEGALNTTQKTPPSDRLRGAVFLISGCNSAGFGSCRFCGSQNAHESRKTGRCCPPWRCHRLWPPCHPP